jgi:hypothetical protein
MSNGLAPKPPPPPPMLSLSASSPYSSYSCRFSGSLSTSYAAEISLNWGGAGHSLPSGRPHARRPPRRLAPSPGRRPCPGGASQPPSCTPSSARPGRRSVPRPAAHRSGSYRSVRWSEGAASVSAPQVTVSSGDRRAAGAPWAALGVERRLLTALFFYSTTCSPSWAPCRTSCPTQVRGLRTAAPDCASATHPRRVGTCLVRHFLVWGFFWVAIGVR